MWCVRYSVDAGTVPERQMLCCCIDCQRHAGSAFGAFMIFPRGSVAVTGGPQDVHDARRTD